MSGYRYDYPLAAPARSGTRSAFASIVAGAAIALISAIGGAAVVLELVAPPQGSHDLTAVSPRSDSKIAEQRKTAAPADRANADRANNVGSATPAWNQSVRVIPNSAPVEKPADQKTNTAVAPSAAPRPAEPAAPPQPAQLPAPPASAPPPTVNPDAAASMSASDLTFAKGYAKRRAAREASVKAAGIEPPKEEVRPSDAKRSDVKETKELKKPDHAKLARARAKRREAQMMAHYRYDRYDRADYNDRYERRDSFGFGRSFGFGDDHPRPMRRVQGPGLFGDLF